MNDTVIPVGDIPAIDHREAMALAAREYDRLLDLLRVLEPGEWAQPTDCDEWDVAAMVRHLLGAAEANASMRQNLHQMRAGSAWGKANGRPLVDGLGAVQVGDRGSMTPDELVARLEAVAPRAVKGRTRLPAPMRKLVKMNVEAPGITEKWSLGYLNDIIYTRDAWMHRIDISRATGRALVLDQDHDGRLLADIVAEWARRHGQPFTLELTGPAGGTYAQADGGESIRIDAAEFARTLSRRAEGAGLLAQAVPF